jgi:hypothetical protein
MFTFRDIGADPMEFLFNTVLVLLDFGCCRLFFFYILLLLGVFFRVGKVVLANHFFLKMNMFGRMFALLTAKWRRRRAVLLPS